MIRKKKRKNRIFLFISIVMFILCTGITISLLLKAYRVPQENLSENQTQTIINPIQEIRGTIKDATMNTLVINDENGCEYHFNTENISISTGETGLMIGNPVAVSYRGSLDSNMSVQKIELISIIVTDAVSDSDNSYSETPIEPTESIESNESSVMVIQKAEEILNKMTLEEKVGQMFIARCPEKYAVQKAEEYHIGGYILFGRDFLGKTKEEVVEIIQSYQDIAEIPMLIGVDEEGGTVNRVSKNPNLRATPFLSPQELYEEGGFDLIRNDTNEKCELLHSLGINLNFAPVCDVSQNPNDFIYNRSFGQDAKQTAVYIQTVVETMNENKMGSVLKHFPGYGNNEDTHTGIAYDERSYETFLNSDFLPFQAGIDAGANMVLVSHNVISCIDDQSPASLSLQVHNILREKLGFTGVIITDDLAMNGVRDFAEDTKIAVYAVQAGNDILCCTNFELQIPAVLEAVKCGDITEERINESVLRILELKISLGII